MTVKDALNELRLPMTTERASRAIKDYLARAQSAEAVRFAETVKVRDFGRARPASQIEFEAYVAAAYIMRASEFDSRSRRTHCLEQARLASNWAAHEARARLAPGKPAAAIAAAVEVIVTLADTTDSHEREALAEHYAQLDRRHVPPEIELSGLHAFAVAGDPGGMRALYTQHERWLTNNFPGADHPVRVRAEAITSMAPPGSSPSAHRSGAGQAPRATRTPSPSAGSNGEPASAHEALADLIGLREVKDHLLRLEEAIQIQHRRAEAGLRTEELGGHHLVFTGNPGTGKTTVARLIGELYRDLGILKHGHVVEVDRSSLIAKWIGHSEDQTIEKLNEALGGVLFIDEAYALASREDSNDFGKPVIDTILKFAEDHRSELVIILAGYPDKMTEFMQSNPGLASRFSRTFRFANYTDDELVQIFESLAEAGDYDVTPEALDAVRNVLRGFVRDRDFGNGRVARDLFERTIERQGARLVNHTGPSIAVLRAITARDIPPISELDAAVTPARSTEELDAELASLVGIKPAKQRLAEIVAGARIAHERAAAGLPPLAFDRHLVFTGNPGTGKTTMARLLGEYYRGIGVLGRGHLVTATRANLVGQHIGETAQKVRAVFEQAIGGVLFIDEAYALTDGGDHDFGREAIHTLNQLIEEHRDDTVVILAGYPDMMQSFDAINPGWSSRFSAEVHFPDFTITEQIAIIGQLAAAEQLVISDETLERFGSFLHSHRTSPRYANGRGARQLLSEAKRTMTLRLVTDAANTPGSSPLTVEQLSTIVPTDVPTRVPARPGAGELDRPSPAPADLAGSAPPATRGSDLTAR